MILISLKRIPIYLHLYDMQNRKLKDFIIHEVGIDRDQYRKDKNRYIIFLDALNETQVWDEQKIKWRNIKSFIDEELDENSKTILFISTQASEAAFEESKRFQLFELQPIQDENDIFNYLTRCSPEKFPARKDAENLYNNSFEVIKDFISTPIILSILAIVYKKGMNISNPGELFEKYKKFLCRAKDDQQDKLPGEYRDELIPSLAFYMCENNLPKIKKEDFIDFVNKNKHISDHGTEAANLLTKRFQILRYHSKNELEFFHEMIRDYFAAVYMRNNYEECNQGFNSENDFHFWRIPSFQGAIKFLVSISDPDISKKIIRNFIEHYKKIEDKIKKLFDLIFEHEHYTVLDLFVWSSIKDYDEKLKNSITEWLKWLNFFKDPLGELWFLELGVKYFHLFNNSVEKLIRQFPLYRSREERIKKLIRFYKKLLDLYSQNNINQPLKYATYEYFIGLCYYISYLDVHKNKAIIWLKRAKFTFEKNDLSRSEYYAKCLKLLHSYCDFDPTSEKNEVVKYIIRVHTIPSRIDLP